MSLSCLDTIKNGRNCNKANHDTIIMAIDKSGSMNSIIDGTIEGVNVFINDQKTLGKNCKFTLFTFNDKIEKTISMIDLFSVPTITKDIIKPESSTALYDAIKTSIDEMDKINTKGDKTIVIMTDGFENSSKTICHNQLMEMIKKSQDKGYKFIYLGANQDAIRVARSFGIQQDSALTYSPSPKYAKEAFRCASMSAKRQRNGEECGFTKLERECSCEPSIDSDENINDYIIGKKKDVGFDHFYR